MERQDVLTGVPPRGKGSPKDPGQPRGSGHLLHDGPDEAAAQNDGGHHEQVEVDQVEVLSRGGGLGVMWARHSHTGFLRTLSPLPTISPSLPAWSMPQKLSPFSAGLQWSQARKLKSRRGPGEGKEDRLGMRGWCANPPACNTQAPAPVPLLPHSALGTPRNTCYPHRP